MKSSFALMVLFCVIIFPGASKNIQTSLAGGKLVWCSGDLNPKTCILGQGGGAIDCLVTVNEFDTTLPKEYVQASNVLNPDDCSFHFWAGVPCNPREEEKRNNNCRPWF